MLTSDGARMAFVEHWPQRVCVADSGGVRQVVSETMSCCQYWITPDGHWVLATGWPLDQEYRRKPPRFWLCNVDAGRQVQTELPFELPKDLRFAYVKEHSRPLEQEVDRSEPPATESGWCMVTDPPSVMVGPVAGEFYCWQPDGESREWKRISPEEFAHWATRADCVLPAKATSPERDPFIVPLPCDGWNAARTVWVRPDGKVVELTRLRYVPNWIQMGLAIINAPLLVFPYHANFFGGEMKSQFQGMSYDRRTNSEAQIALQRAIELRRTRNASQGPSPRE